MLKKIRVRKKLLMAPDFQLGQSQASSLIRVPPDQLFLSFYPPIDGYKSIKVDVEKNDCRCLNWPKILGFESHLGASRSPFSTILPPGRKVEN